MHYIAEIVVESGRVPCFRFPSLEKGTNIVAAIFDETGKNYLVQSKTNLSSELLGFGVDVNYASGYLVEHSKKAAKFFEFVEHAETNYLEFSENTAERVPMGWDSLVLGNAYVTGGSNISGHRRIIINTSIEAIGVCGSVATRSGTLGVNPKLLTMYDLFGELCRETGVNLLRYYTVVLLSSIRCSSTEIRLKHTDESELFFTKMYLDVMKR